MTAPGLHLFYPIVPDVTWLRRLLPQGIKTVQLRIKYAAAESVREQISISIELTREAGCQLVVNDYWQEAIEAGADYIHLGQEDLAAADLSAIKKAGIRLGISTHSEDELAVALAASPDYVALGPIYETRLKVMKWAPQGLDRIRRFKALIGGLPLVAIGGITPERAQGVVAAGAQSVAVITDLVTAADPEARVRQWLAWAKDTAATSGGEHEKS